MLHKIDFVAHRNLSKRKHLPNISGHTRHTQNTYKVGNGEARVTGFVANDESASLSGTNVIVFLERTVTVNIVPLLELGVVGLDNLSNNVAAHGFANKERRAVRLLLGGSHTSTHIGINRKDESLNDELAFSQGGVEIDG
jgi:hypothetical protein